MQQLRWMVLVSVVSLVLSPLRGAHAGIVLGGANTRVTDAAQLDAWVGEPDITQQGGTLYAVWRDGRRTDSQVEADIVFAKSTDGGATWSANRIVSNNQFVGFTHNPSISVSPDGTIWIAWGLDACYDVGITCGGSELNNDVRAAWSTDGGTTWTEGTLWNGTEAGIGDDVDQRPEIQAQDDRIFTLAHDPTFSGGDVNGFHVVLHVITRTTSLTAGYVLLTPGGSTGRQSTLGGPLSALAVRGNTVCAAWEDQRDSASIYGTCSTNRAVSFPAATRWSTNGNDTEPRLAFAPDGRLVLGYKDQDKKDIVVRTSTDNGATWGTPRAATTIGSNYTFHYDLTVGPDNQILMPVVMSSTSTASQSDLNVVSSIDGGLTFGIRGPIESGSEPYLGISTQFRVSVAATGTAGDARAHFLFADDRGDPLVVSDLIWAASAALDATPPTTPANLRATDGDSSIGLEWDSASDANGVAYYDVWRSTASSGPFTRINALPVTQTAYRDVGLTAGTYYYRVQAVDTTANPGPQSATVSATATVGGAVTGLSGVMAYDTTGGVGVRQLTAGVVGAETLRGGGSFPAYSIDGQKLYFLSGGGVVAGDRSGANPQTVFTDAQAIAEFDLPADANFIAGIFQDDYNGACVPFEARLVQNAPRATVATTSNTNVDSVAVSPDRRWVAYTNRLYCTLAGTVLYDTNRLCLIDTTAVGLKETCLEPANVQGSDFGNTGSLLVFSANYSGQNEIWRASVAGDGGLVNLMQITRGPVGQPATRPRVSTDGNWVAFLRDIDAGMGEDLRIHVVRADGDSPRNLGVTAQTVVWSGGGPAGPVVGLSERVYLPLLRR